MKERIVQLIMDSFKDEFYNKAMSCIHALRRESIKVLLMAFILVYSCFVFLNSYFNL